MVYIQLMSIGTIQFLLVPMHMVYILQVHMGRVHYYL